ncbi:potassium voltage-gated channel subfamily A member 2-like [Exaiptasia diaphana]|uniref:Uncharacterized protein n=1 Tax=Exaiptasia diaphana TaxID=2652724 RepID=A0A913WXB0_EXADI|nr:potassium voltage-gated channel subfamily A member 2-like [Exaiptasia diaphana]
MDRCLKRFQLQRQPKRVVINIRGARFETFEKTLEEFPETLLGNVQKRMAYYDYMHKEYYFDRDMASFDAILFYYQSKGILSRPDIVPEKVFEDELNFYGITDRMRAKSTNVLKDHSCSLPSYRWQKMLWIFLEQPDSSYQAKWFSRFSVVVIILSIIAFCAETIYIDAHADPWLDGPLENSTYSNLNGSRQIMYTVRPKTWFWIDTFITSWFCFEYLARLASSPFKIKFIFSALSLIDLIAIFPFFISLYVTTKYKHAITLTVLRVFRLLRVSRVLKLTRYIAVLRILGYSIRTCHYQLFSLAIFLIISVVMFSSVVYFIEKDENPQFTSIFQSFWWCIITMTTVGYGDVVLQTTSGKIVGAFCAIFGVVVVLCLPTPVFVLQFNKLYCEFLGIELKDKGLTGVKKKNYAQISTTKKSTYRNPRK